MLNYALEAQNGLVIFENNMPHAAAAADEFTTSLKEDVEREELEKAQQEAARLRVAALQAQRKAELQKLQAQQITAAMRNALIVTNLFNAMTLGSMT
jgi:hypothetical protein